MASDAQDSTDEGSVASEEESAVTAKRGCDMRHKGASGGHVEATLDGTTTKSKGGFF